MRIDCDKEKAMLGAHVAVIGVLLAFFLVHAPGQQARPTAKPSVADRTTKASSRKKAMPIRLAGQIPAPAAITPPPQKVLFPEPTRITIAVAAASQLVKLDAYQNPLSEDAKKWDCVTDRTTGLVWEVKTSDKGLRDAGNYYSWYSSKSQYGIAGQGTRDNGKCRGGIDCDTQSYIHAINKKNLCGYSDWRLPSRKELLSLVRGQTQKNQTSTIDTRFFPRAPGDWYWTSDSDLGDTDHAWYVLFFNGRTMKALKSRAKRVRLVRGGEHASPGFKNVAEKNEEGDKTNELARQPFATQPNISRKKKLVSLN